MTSQRVRTLLLVCIMCTLIFIIFTYPGINKTKRIRNPFYRIEHHNMIPEISEMKKSFTNEELCNMSALGRWLISPEGSPTPSIVDSKDTPRLILIWKHGPMLEKRHIHRFSNRKFSPWKNCSAQCLLSYNSSDLEKADAVIFHLHLTKNVKELPTRKNYNQRWIFLTDESPMHTFLHGAQDLSSYNQLFNWSMTYRMDSDIPVPYGRTVLSSTLRKQSFFHVKLKKKKKLLAVMGSNCAGSNNRWDYVHKLKLLLGDDLDVIGHCLKGNTTVCPGHFRKDCKVLEEYKFYLAFENSNCKEYLTEKVFWNGYEKLAIPVIMGAPREDCERLLPPNSFLHVSEFPNPSALADHLRNLERNDNYFKFHEWRCRYKVINEHGYFGSASRHYCRVCEALYYNSAERKVYSDLPSFWNKKKDCSL